MLHAIEPKRQTKYTYCPGSFFWLLLLLATVKSIVEPLEKTKGVHGFSENKAVVLLKSVTCKRASEPCVLHLLQVYDVSLVAVTVLDSFVQALFSKKFNLSGHSEDWP